MTNASPPHGNAKKRGAPIVSLSLAALSGLAGAAGGYLGPLSYYGIFLVALVTIILVLVLSGTSCALAIAWFADGRRAMPGIAAIVCALGLPLLGACWGYWLYEHRAECSEPVTMEHSPNKRGCAK
jgi:hypothetical protein